MKLGYLRVSKGDSQTPELQRQGLDKAGVDRFFEDRAGGGRWDRPGLQKMLDHLRPGDVVMVWKLDRLSRSLPDMLRIVSRIKEAGAGFSSLTESIDTTTPAGEMFFHVCTIFADYERKLIVERTRAGLDAARAEGRVGGRRPKLNQQQRKKIADDVVSGRSTAADAARLWKVSPPTISRIVAEHRGLESGRD